MTESCDGVDCGKSDCPCKQETQNSSEESHSSQNSNEREYTEAEWIGVRTFFSQGGVERDEGDYSCDLCHGVGTLLSCDTCPSTFHLECLRPPMELGPRGVWQCQKCCPLDDSSASKGPKRRFFFSRLKHSYSYSILSLGKKQLNETSHVLDDPKSRSISVNQKLPSALSLLVDELVEAGNVLGKAPVADAHSETLVANNPMEIDGSSEEEQEEEVVVVSQDLNERPYSESLDVMPQDKLLIPRDVSQAFADGYFFAQNEEYDEPSDSPLEEHLSDAEAKAKKERLAYLRARQKARIAQRKKKVGGPAAVSRPSSNEGPVPISGANFNGFSGLPDKSSSIVPKAATPLRMIRHEDAGNEGAKQSSEKTDNCKRSLENHSVNSNQKRLNHNQKGSGDEFPGFPTKEAPNPECLIGDGVKRQKTAISEFPSPGMITLPPQPRDVYPHKILTSNFFSGFPMPSPVYDDTSTINVDEAWSNKELDSLWLGIRKYCEGNWLQMLTDHNLCFSRGKTATDLAKMWEKEKAKHFGPQVATTDRPGKGKRKMDSDLNPEPSLEGWMSSESSGKKAKSDEPKLLVGIHIEIPVNQPAPVAGGSTANQMQMEGAVFGPGGMSSSRMQTQEAVSREGGNGANRKQEAVKMSSDSDDNSSESEAGI